MKTKALATLAIGTLGFGTVIGTSMVASAAQGAVPRYVVVQKSFTGQPATPRNFTVSCPRGRTAVGGGAHAGQGSFSGSPDAGVFASDISSNRRGWTVSVFVGASFGPTAFTADVICATP